MERNAKIFVAGHRGMVGSAITRRLLAGGFENVVTRTRAGLIVFNSSKPDGTPPNLPDVRRAAALGWQAKVGLRDNIRMVHQLAPLNSCA